MSFNIEFDFRFDTSGFFTNAAREALDFAAGVWEDVILDDFDAVPAGIEFSVKNPSDRDEKRLIELNEPIDDLLVFVAAEPLNAPGDGTVLGRAGPTGTDAAGSVFNARIENDFRGTGPVTDFEPWAGSVTFNPDIDWSFDVGGPVDSKSDFISTATHEIGHILGFGVTPLFDTFADENNEFDGPNAVAANGSPVPMESDFGHVEEGFLNNDVLMDPENTKGERKEPTDIDLALLADIGYEVEGFEAQGSTPPIATDSGELIFGTVVDDLIEGKGGDDQLQGDDGDDVLNGGLGDDTLFGQAGADSLFGGLGDDTLVGGAGADRVFMAPGDGNDTLSDFELGVDHVEVDAAFGFTDADAVLETVSKPFTNVSRLNLDAGTTLDIFHNPQVGSPLTADDIVIVNQTPTENQTPAATNDNAQTTTEEAIRIDVLANDSDPDGDTLSIDDPGSPSNGAVVVTADGEIRYTSNAGFTGQETFTYTVADGNGGTDTASVTVTVEPAPDEPDSIGENDDFELLQRTSPGVVSAGQGDDTYLLSPSILNGDEELTLQDGQGSNRIQLVEGLPIAESTVAANALRLVLENGAVINVNGADEFEFEAGANAVAGAMSANVSFNTFVSETLGLQTPTSGTVEGGSLAIGDGSTPPDTAPIGAADDFVLLQRTSPGVTSAGQGDDTYILSQNTLNGDENLTLQDGQGSDRIQLVDGLEIARSTVAANALQLELANGSVINVNDADAFSYEPGGNAVAGVDGEEVSFDTFVSETLGTDAPTSGTSEGGSVTIDTFEINLAQAFVTEPGAEDLAIG